MGYLVLTYLIAVAVGSFMGYLGGKSDMLGLRFVEIWANVPFLYMVIILVSVMPGGLGNRLAGVFAFDHYGTVFMDWYDLLHSGFCL
jgi:ABC-type microcin C transport system permease subunit YejE